MTFARCCYPSHRRAAAACVEQYVLLLACVRGVRRAPAPQAARLFYGCQPGSVHVRGGRAMQHGGLRRCGCQPRAQQVDLQSMIDQKNVHVPSLPHPVPLSRPPPSCSHPPPAIPLSALLLGDLRRAASRWAYPPGFSGFALLDPSSPRDAAVSASAPTCVRTYVAPWSGVFNDGRWHSVGMNTDGWPSRRKRDAEGTLCVGRRWEAPLGD